MKILFLTGHLPVPPNSGGRRRELELISRLSKDFEIHLCTITKTWETDSIFANYLSRYCKSVNVFRAVAIDNQKCQSYPSQMTQYLSKHATSHISSSLRNKSFDLVHVEGYYLMQHLPAEIKIPILLVEHNVEYLLALQRFMLATSWHDKSFYMQESLSILKWEQTFWKQATMCVTLTMEDKNAIRQLDPDINIRTIPNGFDHNIDISESILPSGSKNPVLVGKYPSILFVGNFNYEPNIDAALYFSKFVFPLIIRDVPDAKLFLVGNAPPPEICALRSNKRIEVSGYVSSLVPYYRSADVIICPLRIGGGIKVKILEALNAGKAIVTTSIGAQGLGLGARRAVIVSDDNENFAKNVVRILLDPIQRNKQEQKASGYVRRLLTWDKVSETFAHCYKEMAMKG